MDGASDSAMTRSASPEPAQPLRPVLLGFGADVALSLIIGVALLLTLSIAWSFALGFRTALAGASEAEVGRGEKQTRAHTTIVILIKKNGSTPRKK